MQKKIKITIASPDEELKIKEEAFRKLAGTQRLALLLKVRERMKAHNVDYSYKGLKPMIKISLLSA